MTTLFIRFPRLTVLVVFFIVAAGLGALLVMGRQEDPTLTERFGLIVTAFPGASAERVEALVTEPIEARLLELAELSAMDSESRSGVSIITIELREDLRADRVDQAWTLVRDQVELARQSFPDGVGAPDVDRQFIGAATLMVAVRWADGREDAMGLIGRLAEDLEDRLQTTPRTEETRLFGAPQEEVRVLAQRDRLAALGLTAADVAARIAGGDPKAPAGQVRAPGVNLGVQVAGELDSLTRVRDVPVLQDPNGDVVRVGDIARVEKGVREPPEAVALVDGRRAVIVAAYLAPNSRSDVWTATARDVVADFQASLPAEVRAEIIFEQNVYVDRRLNGLLGNLGFSALIVFAVLFLMMGWRAALIVGAALPLTTLLVVFLVRAIGQPLHQMSVTGLVIALGLLIDNAIVMVHEYRLRRAAGAAPFDAADRAVRHLFLPLLASTITTMLAFAPIALMPGAAGEFVGMIGVSVIFAVGASLFLAMTVVPAFAAWFDRSPAPGARAGFLTGGVSFGPLTRVYRGTLRVIARVPILGVALALPVPVAGFYAAAVVLPMQFFPPTDRDMFQLQIELPPETAIAETRRVVEDATAMLTAYDGLEHVSWVLGQQPPRTYYNVLASGTAQPNFAAGWARTSSEETTRAIVEDFAFRARDAFPQARFLVLPFEQGPPVDAPLELQLLGPDFETLSTLGDDIRLIMADTRNVTYTSANLKLGAPVATLRADEAAVAVTGRSLSDLVGVVRDDLDGAVGGSVLEATEELPVRVILGDADRASLEAVRGKLLPAEAGSTALGTPLGAFGDVALEPEVATITRKDGERVNRLYGYVRPFTLPDVALSDLRARLAASDIVIPDGYRLEYGGEADARGAAMANLFSTAAPLLILMAGSLVLAFNSFRYAGVVALVAVLSVGLAMFGVWMFGEPNGFQAIVGTMGLVGLAVNGAIVVLSALRADPQARAGDVEAIVDTTGDATRHIISTTLTTVGGFTPLILSGDSFWLPLATAIAGGVAGSAVLALFFAPAMFAIMTKGDHRRQQRREAATGVATPAPAQ